MHNLIKLVNHKNKRSNRSAGSSRLLLISCKTLERGPTLEAICMHAKNEKLNEVADGLALHLDKRTKYKMWKKYHRVLTGQFTELDSIITLLFLFWLCRILNNLFIDVSKWHRHKRHCTVSFVAQTTYPKRIPANYLCPCRLFMLKSKRNKKMTLASKPLI